MKMIEVKTNFSEVHFHTKKLPHHRAKQTIFRRLRYSNPVDDFFCMESENI